MLERRNSRIRKQNGEEEEEKSFSMSWQQLEDAQASREAAWRARKKKA